MADRLHRNYLKQQLTKKGNYVMYNLIFSSDRYNKSSLTNHRNAQTVHEGLNSLGMQWRTAEGVFDGKLERSFIVCDLTWAQASQLTKNICTLFDQDCVLIIDQRKGECVLEHITDVRARPVSIGRIAMQTDKPQSDYTFDHTNQVYYIIN
jgi:hypothetical protein